MFCLCNCCRWGFPLAGLTPGQGLPVCKPGAGWLGGRPSRLRIMEGVLGAVKPARGMEHPKIVKVPKVLGIVHLDNFVYLSFIPSGKLCSILSPLAALSLLGSLSDCPPRSSGYEFLSSKSSWNLCLSRYSACLSFPTLLNTRAPCNVGSCSQSRPPRPGVQQSQASTPSLLHFSSSCW